MSAALSVGEMLHWLFMFMIAVVPPHGDHDAMPTFDSRKKGPSRWPVSEMS